MLSRKADRALKNKTGRRVLFLFLFACQKAKNEKMGNEGKGSSTSAGGGVCDTRRITSGNCVYRGQCPNTSALMRLPAFTAVPLWRSIFQLSLTTKKRKVSAWVLMYVDV
jgi:hypothetical protein